MRVWDSVTKGGSLRPGPAAFIILLAGITLSLAPVSRWIEAAYYDFLQQLQDRPASPDIVLVNTSDLAKPSSTIWDSPEFPDLLRLLGAARVRLIVPVSAAPANAALPDSAQLAVLAEIERRSRQDGDASDNDAGGRPDDAFTTRLGELRRRAELNTATIQAAAQLRNLVVAVPIFESTRSLDGFATNCRKHVFNTQTPLASNPELRPRRVRSIMPLPESLCQAAVGVGYTEFWPDADGVVRRADLLIEASGDLIPASALTTVLSVTSAGGELPTVTPSSISWDSQHIRTSQGLTTLIRFIAPRGDRRTFETVSAKDLLRQGAGRKSVTGKIVVVGKTGPDAEPTYVTPISQRTPAAILLATTLSNLLQQDYLIRPAVLPWLEYALMALIGGVIMLWGHRLAPAMALMVGICTATLLLAAEAYLVLNQGIWAQLGTAAIFALVAMAAIQSLPRAAAQAQRAIPTALAAPAGAPAKAPISGEDELDLAFSVLRHQPGSDHVKKRLYDVALEHARQRDLAKAERVLRHLAGLDPDYKHVGDKLKKLAGLRNAQPAPGAVAPLRPVPPMMTPQAEPASLSGQTIGRYEIETPIGRGAMATVYLGRDPKINRRVAIKTIALAEEFSDNELANARTQFLREAESAGRLNHPDIISIYDVGEDGPVAYLAMEFFAGKPLSFYAQQDHLLPARHVFELMARAAEALHYAHSQRVVHRDVKPANLLYDANSDTLKITDFGIARLTDTSRTKTGIILGTPSYMSPEQLAGTNVTGQSDLFSLGITLYQLLTGVAPFRADSIPRLMQKIAHEQHEPLRKLREDLPACADEFMNRALAKDPADRYESGRAMALALRDCCSSFEVSVAVEQS